MTNIWFDRTVALLHDAIGNVEDEDGCQDDVLSAIGAAEVAYRIGLGEVDPEELEEYPFPGEPAPELPCTCSPEMIARNDGSFRGGCLRHSSGARILAMRGITFHG